MKSLFLTRRYALALLLALASIPYFVNLGASSLWDSNEAFYAETPREMIESGDYINPSFNYQPRFNKPPLCYWVVAAFYKIFGVSEAVERLPIALGAMVMIGIAFFLGREIFSIEAGLFSALALALSPRFLMFSRRIIIDVYVAMFCGLALLFFVLSETRPERRRLYLILMYAAIGLGVLTKGPVAAVLPAAVFLVYLAFTRNPGKLREMMLPAGILIVVAIVLPWYAAIYFEHGWLYIRTFVLDDNLSRYTEPVWGPRRGLFFYLPVALGDMFPWSLFLLIGLWLAGRRLLRSRFWKQESDSDERASLGFQNNNLSALLVIWAVVIVVFFSISRNKEDLYILPAYPAAAAIIGGLFARRIEWKLRKPLLWTVAVAGVLLMAGGAAVIYLFKETYELVGATVIGYIAVAGGLVTIVMASLKKEFIAIVCTAMIVIGMNWTFVLRTIPDFERYKPARAFSEIIRDRAGPDAVVGYYRLASPSMSFYLRRPIFEYYELKEIRAAFATGREIYCLLTAEDYEAIRKSLPAPTLILASRPLFRLKLRGILDRTELPQVLLISGGSRTNSSE